MTQAFRYLIVGGGMAADAAVRGIRQVDPEGRVGLFSKEPDPPYNRPPLSKGLWKRTPLSRIWRRTDSLNVELFLSRAITRLETARKQVEDDLGQVYSYEKLLLATGGDPIRISQESERIIYFRTLADYHRLQSLTKTGQHFAVIGGGFIGSELAAVLAGLGKSVTMIFPETGIGARILPGEISTFLNRSFQDRGIKLLLGEWVHSLSPEPDRVTIQLGSGQQITVDGVVAGLGIRPNVALAQEAGLEINNGIVVDSTLRANNHPDIWAAGDVISFFNPTLNRWMRVEHEENANLTGQMAGKGMAGQPEEYHHLPSVYSSLFEIQYDAVGELDPAHEIVYDWQEPYQKGVLYYLHNQRVRGVLLWNVGRGLDLARQIIADPGPWQRQDLTGKIPG